MVASDSAPPTQKGARGRPPGSGRKQKYAAALARGRKHLLKVPTQIDPLLKEPFITTDPLPDVSQMVEIDAPVTYDGTASPSQDCIVQAMTPTGGPLAPETNSSRDSSGARTRWDISGSSESTPNVSLLRDLHTNLEDPTSESDNDNDPEFCVDQPIAIGGDLEWVAVMYQAFVNLLQQVPGQSVGLSNRIMNSGILVAQALKDCRMVGQMKEFTKLWKKAVKFARIIENAPTLDQHEWFGNFIEKQNKKIDKEIKNLRNQVEQYWWLKLQAAERVTAALHEAATVSSALADIERRLKAALGEKEKRQADNEQILNDPSRRESLRQEVILHAESEFRQLAENCTSLIPY